MTIRAVIFGGAGFIGTHLARDLRSDGNEVLCVDLRRPQVGVPGVRYEYADVRDPIHLRRSGSFDVAFNLAAVHRTPGHLPHEYYDVNILGAQNVTEWCAATYTNQLVFTSSIAVYGASETLMDEDSPLVPNSDYGRSKVMAENIHRQWRNSGADGDRQLVIVRPAVVFGSGENGNFTRLADGLRRRRFAYAGRRDTIKACGSVSDLVRALTWARGVSDNDLTFNYCFPRAYTIEDICVAFHYVAGYPEPIAVPAPIVNGLSRALKLANPRDRGLINAARIAKLVSSTNVAPRVLVDRGFTWETDLRRAIEDWRTTSCGTFQ